MKTRNGFVSNSSSSSFIIIGNTENKEEITKLRKNYGNCDDLSIGPNLGHHQFGWEEERYTSFWDKVIFAWIQAEYVKGTTPQWMKMLNKVLKAKLKVKNIYWNLSIDFDADADSGSWAYIDHQSASIEGANTEMFDSEENLVNFLFAKDSYIQGGNDNN